MLGIDFELKFYKRNSDYMAPPSIKEVSSIGLFPILEVFKDGASESSVICESGHIISYLARNYDPTGILKTSNDDDYELADYYLHFAEGSLQPHLVSLLVGAIACKKAPWPANYLVKQVITKINDLYYGDRLKKALLFLESQLEKKEGDYFVGNSLTVADLILDFPINNNIFGNADSRDIGFIVDPKKEYPNLYKWHQLTTSLPSHIKAVAREQSEFAKL